MKKLIATLGIIFAVVICIQAQESNGGNLESQTTKVTTKISNACNLSQDQIVKIRPFVQQFVQTRNENKQKYSNDKQGLQASMKTDRQQLVSNLKTVLNEDQMAEFKTAMVEQYRQRKASSGSTR